MSEAPLPRLSLGEAAYFQLRAEIISCRLAPGMRLTEKELAADTGFGLSPVREALRRLDHDGLIRTLPRRGYQVTPLTPKSIDDLFDMWEIVGPEIVRLGISRASEAELAELKAGFQGMGEIVQESEDPDSAVRMVEAANETFGVLANATTNDYLISAFNRVTGDMSRVWALIMSADPGALHGNSPHQLLRDILDQRDADHAAETARQHIREFHIRALQIVIRWPSVMSTEVVPIRR